MDQAIWGVVIVAAGSGERFGSGIPKQFLPLKGKTVLDWSLDVFMRMDAVTEVVVVTPVRKELWEPFWSPPAGVRTVAGGARRQDSVMAGLKALHDADHVLIHDAARPLVTPALVLRVMDAALSSGAAVPVVPVRDTVKRVSSGSEVLSTVPRDELRLSQTPQGFSLERLITVLKGSEEVTDEAAAMESTGAGVTAVRGDTLNMKLTYPEDLEFIASVLPGEMETRSGLGLDFHPFQEGRELRLAGCLIQGYSGLAGHSDGDAVLHAAADALLAASRLGDIGVHFPPGDPEWEDADSSEILRRTWAMVRGGGWTLTQLDITVMAEFPRITQLRDMMIRSIAEILQVREDLIWIKGTTTNTLGDIGRGRGLGCMALAVLRRSADREPRSGGDS